MNRNKFVSLLVGICTIFVTIFKNYDFIPVSYVMLPYAYVYI